MNAIHRQQVRDAFSGARDYDHHARVQRLVARRLAKRIAALEMPGDPRILEIGCGTGFLTEALIAEGVAGEWLVSDISPAMVARCRRRVGNRGNMRFAVLDGEYGEPGGGGGFDLICSSLVMQWFDDPAAALERMLAWLAPDGHCMFATLASGSLAQWRSAHDDLGLECGTPQFPTLAEMERMSPAARDGALGVERMTERQQSALEFLHSLRAIGAGTAVAGHRPLSPGDLRSVMHRFEQQGSCVTYEVVYGHFLHR